MTTQKQRQQDGLQSDTETETDIAGRAVIGSSPAGANVFTPFPQDALVRAAAAARILSVSPAQFYKMLASNPAFPKAVAVSPNVRAYWVSELLAWAKSRPRVSGGDAASCQSQRANLEKSPYRQRAA